METLLGLSANVNWGYNTRNTSLLLDSSAKLFNYVLPQNKGGQILLQLEGQGDTQVVGAAFSYGAIMFDNGDPSVNSVMVNPAKRKAMVAKNEKRFLKQKRNVLQKSESLSFRSDYPVKIQASFKRLLKAV